MRRWSSGLHNAGVSMLLIFSIGVVLSACSSVVACSVAGAESGVAVTLALPASEQARIASGRICVDKTCATVPVTPGRGSFFGVLDVLEVGLPTTVQVTVLSANGATLQSGTASVTPTEFRPNGPKCPPVAAHADVTLDATGLRPS